MYYKMIKFYNNEIVTILYNKTIEFFLLFQLLVHLEYTADLAASGHKTAMTVCITIIKWQGIS